MDDNFRFEIAQKEKRARIALFGDFDMTGVLRLEPELGRVLSESDVEEVELDLSRLNFIDSTGLGVVMDLDARARRGELAWSIVPGPRQVQRVFEVTHLEDILPFKQSDST